MPESRRSQDGLPPEKRASGWIKAWRSLLQSPSFRNPKIAHFWLYCLLKATYRARQVLVGSIPVDLEPGQFIFGRARAAEETGLSEQNVRTALVALCRRGSLKSTIHSTKQFSVVTIVNWHVYQADGEENNQPSNQGPTNLQPTSNHKQEDQEGGEEEGCAEGKAGRTIAELYADGDVGGPER